MASLQRQDAGLFNAADFIFATVIRPSQHSIKRSVILLSVGMGGQIFQAIREAPAKSSSAPRTKVRVLVWMSYDLLPIKISRGLSNELLCDPMI